MNVMVPLPDEFAARFGAEAERDRHVLKVFAPDDSKAGRMLRPALRRVIAFDRRGELDGFHKQRGVDDGITVEEFGRQIPDLDRNGA